MKKKLLTMCLAITMLFSNMSVSAASLTAKQVEANNLTVQETHVISNNSPNKKTTVTTNDEKTEEKITIDGLGTILFTFVGIILMAGTVAAMRRNREEC